MRFSRSATLSSATTTRSPLSSCTYTHSCSTPSRCASTSSKKISMSEAAAAFTPRRPLKCPGGNRMTSQGVKAVLKVSSSGQLKRLDQRFILNLKLTHQIMGNLSEHLEGSMPSSAFGGDTEVNKGVENGKIILEIGPGPGALTRSLLTRQTIGVLGVEVDPRFNSYLEQIHQQTGGKFHWANADIMATDEFSLLKEHFPKVIAKMESGEQHFHSNENSSAEGEERDDSVDGGDFFGSTKASSSASSSRGAQSTVLRNGFHVPLRSTHRESILKRRQHLAFGSASLGLGGTKHGTANNNSTRGKEGEEEADAENDDFFGENKSQKRQRVRAERKKLTEAELIQARWNSTGGSSLVVISNLPFALSTGLLMRYSFDAYNKAGIYKLGRTPVYCLLPQMIANRLIALPPGTRTQYRKTKASSPDAPVNDERLLSRSYGRPSILFQNYFHVRVHRLFSEKTFYPPTDVMGAFVQLTPRSKPLVDIDPASLVAFLNTTFLGRLKSRAVGAALRQAMPVEIVNFALQQLRIDNAVTIGQLTVREIALLAKVWERYMLSTNQSMKEASEKAREAEKEVRRQQWEEEAKAEEEKEANSAAPATVAEEEVVVGTINKDESWSLDEEETCTPAQPEHDFVKEENDDDPMVDMIFSGMENDAEETKDQTKKKVSSFLSSSSSLSEAERFARDASALGGDAELFSTRGDGKRITRRVEGGGLFVQKGGKTEEVEPIEKQIHNPRDAFVEDAMEFFGLDDEDASERDDEDFDGGSSPYLAARGMIGSADASVRDGATSASLRQMLKSAKEEGKREYLKFKKDTLEEN